MGYDREKELKEFDETKAGVKGLVDSGVVQIPRIFIHDRIESQLQETSTEPQHDQTIRSIPTIDFGGGREEIVEQVKEASETWGFFQVVNHGIPVQIMDGMLDGVRGFHELSPEEKKQFYSRDFERKFKYSSNFDLFFSPAASWRDTISCILAPDPPEPEELPIVIRDIILEYSRYMMRFGTNLLEILSEALGLDPNYLQNLGCGEGLFMVGHYYPPCPQPELALATSPHVDSCFFTVLIQDQIGGLQILHQNEWVDVTPLHGALVINVAELLQLITNGQFRSVYHRVLATQIGPRISVASFFRTQLGQKSTSKIYGPIPELISDENPQIYRETSVEEYLKLIYSKTLDGTSPLSHYKLTK